MIITSAEFIKSATAPEHYPPDDMPEIAFTGRSNAGKSTLINTLVNRKRLVKTGKSPGHTQLINFFIINNSFRFVDLPGYGFAKVPERIRRQWGVMIETYLETRKGLRGAALLMDIRRTPGPDETGLMDWFALRDIPVLPILTKADKLGTNDKAKQRKKAAGALSLDKKELFLFSALNRMGKDALLNRIESLVTSPLEDGPEAEDAP